MLTTMRRLGLIVLTLLLLATPAWAGQNVLTWTDNSTNEANFHIERTTAADVPACQTATGFTEIAVVGMNVVTFTDTAVTEGLTYCYRVDASNTSGVSAFSNIAGRTIPFSVPAPPSNLTVN